MEIVCLINNWLCIPISNNWGNLHYAPWFFINKVRIILSYDTCVTQNVPNLYVLSALSNYLRLPNYLTL